MSRWYSFTLIAFASALFVVFQNFSPTTELSALEKDGVISVDQRLFHGQSHSDPLNYESEVVKLIEFGRQGADHFRYTLDLKTRVVRDANGNGPGAERGLAENEMAEIYSAINGNYLSNRRLMSADEIICLGGQSAAYARITTNRDSYLLGEGIAGCPNQDLYRGVNGLEIPQSRLVKTLNSMVGAQ